jgi:hypothetical protein
MCFGANPSDLGIARPVLYTTIPHADVVEKIIRRCLHHHFRPMKIGMSTDRSPALSPGRR